MDAAQRLALRAGYRNAGTVEFLYEPGGTRFSFMEVNARLQVEHPVTEAVTGLDLVKLQLHVAAGGRLEGEPPAPDRPRDRGAAQRRGPGARFRARAGPARHCCGCPPGPGVRVDTGVAEGDMIPPEFDSMIGKLIAWGRDRDEALARLRRAVADTIVVIDGGTTNQGFLLELLEPPRGSQGRGRHVAGSTACTSAVRRCRCATATSRCCKPPIELADEDSATDRARFYALARRGRPQAAPERGAATSCGTAVSPTGWPWPRSRPTAIASPSTVRRSSWSPAASARTSGAWRSPARATARSALDRARPARRGRRRAPSHLSRRRGHRAQPRPGGRDLDPGLRRRDRRSRETSSPSSRR